MRVKYKDSIRERVDEVISLADRECTDIEYVELTTFEYIQFLEELSDIQRLLIVDPITKQRLYRNVRIKVLT